MNFPYPIEDVGALVEVIYCAKKMKDERIKAGYTHTLILIP